MRASSSFFVPLWLLAAACSGGSSAPVAPPLRLGLSALPAVLQPGSTVDLRPTFPAGAGRIDPDIGPVESGRSYRVGPFRQTQRFTLTVATAGGTETADVEVPVQYRERLQPRDPSPIARTDHRAVDLADGRVLLVGGGSPSPLPWANTELFDPASGTYAPAGELSTGRRAPALVSLPDGSVMSFGGESSTSSFEVATRVEQWDPVALAWSVRGNTLCNRSRHTATRLADGRVLLVGGEAFGGPLAARAAEIWVPGQGARPLAGALGRHRAAHTATLLADGRVLLVGGYDPVQGGLVEAAELFDPATETFAATGPLGEPRCYHAAVRLPDGCVWVAGGEVDAVTVRASVERFDPVTGAWSRGGDLGLARTELRALLLGTAQILVAGGIVLGGAATDRVELWDLRTGTARTVAAPMPSPRSGHSLHLLPDGRVVGFGGDPGSGWPTASAFLFD